MNIDHQSITYLAIVEAINKKLATLRAKVELVGMEDRKRFETVCRIAELKDLLAEIGGKSPANEPVQETQSIY